MAYVSLFSANTAEIKIARLGRLRTEAYTPWRFWITTQINSSIEQIV